MFLATYLAMRRFEFVADTADAARAGLREALEARWKRYGTPVDRGWHDSIQVQPLPPRILLVDGEAES